MTCGVYRIDIGPYFYYGSSNNLTGRKASHLCALRKGRHGNKWMQRAFDRYGEFEFGVIEECEVDSQHDVEQRFLDLYVEDQMCMNMVRIANNMTFDVRRRIADTHTGMIHTEESKAKMRKPKSPEHAQICRENGLKTTGSRPNSTGYVGVSKNRYGRYRAATRINGKYVHVGMFATAEEASTAYQAHQTSR